MKDHHIQLLQFRNKKTNIKMVSIYFRLSQIFTGKARATVKLSVFLAQCSSDCDACWWTFGAITRSYLIQAKRETHTSVLVL